MVRGKKSIRMGMAAIAFSILMFSLFVWPVKASVMLALDLDQLVANSEIIVVATTLGWKSRWDARNRIVTDVTLRVEESIKGKYKAKDQLVVTRLGGEIGNLGMRVEGAEVFYKDKKAIVFLREVPALGELRVVGMSQGVFHYREEEGQTLVGPEDTDLALVERDSDGELTSVARVEKRVLPVEGVLTAIRKLVLVYHAK